MRPTVFICEHHNELFLASDDDLHRRIVNEIKNDAIRRLKLVIPDYFKMEYQLDIMLISR